MLYSDLRKNILLHWSGSCIYYLSIQKILGSFQKYFGSSGLCAWNVEKINSDAVLQCLL